MDRGAGQVAVHAELDTTEATWRRWQQDTMEPAPRAFLPHLLSTFYPLDLLLFSPCFPGAFYYLKKKKKINR